MFKICAMIMIMATGGPTDTGVWFESKVGFPTKEDCQAALDSGQMDAANAKLDEVLAAKTEEDGNTYKAEYQCRAVEDGSI